MPKKKQNTNPEITLKEVVGDKRYRLQIFGPAAITDEGVMSFEVVEGNLVKLQD